MPAAADLAADAEDLRGVKEGLLDCEDAGDRSLVLLGPNFGGFRFWSVSVGRFADPDSLRGATEGLTAGDGAED